MNSSAAAQETAPEIQNDCRHSVLSTDRLSVLFVLSVLVVLSDHSFWVYIFGWESMLVGLVYYKYASTFYKIYFYPFYKQVLHPTRTLTHL